MKPQALLTAAVLSFLFGIGLFAVAHPSDVTSSLTTGEVRIGMSYKTYTTSTVYFSDAAEQGSSVSLIAVGDIMLSRAVADKMHHYGSDYPFEKVTDFLKSADITFANLETSITPGRHIGANEMFFRADIEAAAALKRAGVSIVSLANNHTPNFGSEGILDTVRYLDEAGVLHAGAGADAEAAGAPAYVTVRGIRFAFLAYNDTDVVPDSYEATLDRSGTSFMRIEKMTRAVQAAKANADFVIVSMHAGAEYTDGPNASQTAFAHAAVDAGAELVLGHHPHVVQPLEQYNGKYIFYSLGNFIFDQMWSNETRAGLALKITFTKSGVADISFYPVHIEDFSQPRFLSDAEGAALLGRLRYPLEERRALRWNMDARRFVEATQSFVRTSSPQSGPFQISKSESADLDADGSSETYALGGGTLTVRQGERTIWQSPTAWWVDDFALADATGDGITDLNFSVWKSGNYGNSKPFWVTTDDMSVKNHFFVFDLVHGVMQPVWQSSNLAVPNCAFAVADARDDGTSELIALEGDYADFPACTGHALAVWQWNGWGFSNEWRSVRRSASGLHVEPAGKGVLITTE